MSDKIGKALIKWGKKWKLDGDLIECRQCKRRQQVSHSSKIFPHKMDCSTSTIDRFPWNELAVYTDAAFKAFFITKEPQ